MTTPEQPFSPVQAEVSEHVQTYQEWAAEERRKQIAEGNAFRQSYASSVLGGAVASSLFFNGLEPSRKTV